MGLDFHAKGYEEETPRWAYSGFMRFRSRLAEKVGIPDLHAHYNSERPFPKDAISGLLNHSDCDGHLTHKQCAEIAPRLRELIAPWEVRDYDRVTGNMLADMMDWCAKNKKMLEFC